MARSHLPNSPLVEVACEVKFHGDLSLFSGWGAIQAAVRDRYPKLYVTGAQEGISPLLQPLRLTSDDGADLFMLSINSFAVSTRRYSHFADFERMFRDLHSIFCLNSKPGPRTRFGLRYVNALPPTLNAKASPSELHPHLKLRVSGAEFLEREWATQAQLSFEKRFEDLTLRVSLVQTPGEHQPYPGLDPGVHLDIDCFTMQPGTIEEAPALLGRAHEIVEDAFFDLVTPAYESYMAGTPEEA